MIFNSEVEKYAHLHHGISSLKLDNYKKSTSGIMVPQNYLSPTIIEERNMNVASMDVFSRLMMEGVIYVGTPIDDDVANIVNAQMLFMASVLKKEMQMHLNTPGGGVYAGLAMYDTMQGIVAGGTDIAVTVTGMAASMGSILLQGGTKGQRRALKHSRVMIHQPMGGAKGQVSDILITAEEIVKLQKELNVILSEGSGKSMQAIKKACDRDNWFTAQEAKNYGFIDEVVTHDFSQR
jgi:ATP-dependent Clp protease protease subunit